MSKHPSRKYLLILASISLATAAVLASSLRAKPDSRSTAPAPPGVFVSEPLRRNVAGLDTYIGRFEAVDSVEITPRVSGYIDQVAFRDGDLVSRGQLLFVVDPRPFQAAVDQAEGRLHEARSQLVLATAELHRAATLFESHTIAQGLLDQKTQAMKGAEGAVAIARGALADARLNLDYTQIRAPMAGRIGRHLVSVGNLVQSGANAAALTTIVSSDPIDFYFDIDEASYLRYGGADYSANSLLGNGGRVSIELPGETRPLHVGTLDFIDNRLDRSTGTLRARARIPNADGTLKPGQFGRAQIIGEQSHAALLVPDAAVVTDATEKVLEIVGHDNKVARRPVVLGRLFGELREIRSGLNADDRIIVSGSRQAQVGNIVSPRLQPMQTNGHLTSEGAK
jgi:RND family efflux transporter MFP subunit